MSAPAALTAVSALEIPAEFAHLKETYEGGNGKLLIHIQDPHSNLSGQENLAHTLDAMMSRYGTKLVLSEGGSGDCSLTTIKHIASADIWQRVAKSYLVQGKMSGEEYLNLTTDHAMRIMGIEKDELYLDSLKNYAALAEPREKILAELQKVRANIDKLKNRVYPAELKRYEKQKGEKELIALAKSNGISFEKYPELERLDRLLEKESSINFELANLEQSVMIEEITKRGGKADLDEHLRRMDKLKGENAALFAYFQKTLNIAKANNLDISKYENLNKYGEYLREYSQLDLDRVLDEQTALEQQVYVKILEVNDDGRMLAAIDRYVSLLFSAFRIQMTTDDFNSYTLNEPDFGTVSYEAFLNTKLAEFQYYDDILPYDKILEEAKDSLKAFYDSVSKRDFAFVENIDSMLQDSKEKTAFLIAGGYHTAHLKKLLKEKGYSYAVVTPRVTSETIQSKYERLLLAPIQKEKKFVGVVDGHRSAEEEGLRLALLMSPLAGARLAEITESAGEGSKPTTTDGEKVDSLLRRLKKKNYWVRTNAMLDLGKMREKAAKAVPHIMSQLGDANHNVRRIAAFALADIGPAASAALEPLKRILSDDMERVRQAAQLAIDRISGKIPGAGARLAGARLSETTLSKDERRYMIGELRDAVRTGRFEPVREDGGILFFLPENSVFELKEALERSRVDLAGKSVAVVPGYGATGFLFLEHTDAGSVDVYDRDWRTIAWVKAVRQYYRFRPRRGGPSLGELLTASGSDWLAPDSPLRMVEGMLRDPEKEKYFLAGLLRALETDPKGLEYEKDIRFHTADINDLPKGRHDMAVLPWLFWQPEERDTGRPDPVRLLTRLSERMRPNSQAVIIPEWTLTHDERTRIKTAYTVTEPFTDALLVRFPASGSGARLAGRWEDMSFKEEEDLIEKARTKLLRVAPGLGAKVVSDTVSLYIDVRNGRPQEFTVTGMNIDVYSELDRMVRAYPEERDRNRFLKLLKQALTIDAGSDDQKRARSRLVGFEHRAAEIFDAEKAHELTSANVLEVFTELERMIPEINDLIRLVVPKSDTSLLRVYALNVRDEVAAQFERVKTELRRRGMMSGTGARLAAGDEKPYERVELFAGPALMGRRDIDLSSAEAELVWRERLALMDRLVGDAHYRWSRAVDIRTALERYPLLLTVRNLIRIRLVEEGRISQEVPPELSSSFQYVINELFKNAADAYARAGEEGPIRFRIRLDEGSASLVFEIANNGAELGDIVTHSDGWLEVRSASTRSEPVGFIAGGEGMGLNLAKAIVEMRGGKLEILKDRDGFKTTVRMTLPKFAVEPGVEAPPPDSMMLWPDDDLYGGFGARLSVIRPEQIQNFPTHELIHGLLRAAQSVLTRYSPQSIELSPNIPPQAYAWALHSPFVPPNDAIAGWEMSVYQTELATREDLLPALERVVRSGSYLEYSAAAWDVLAPFVHRLENDLFREAQTTRNPQPLIRLMNVVSAVIEWGRSEGPYVQALHQLLKDRDTLTLPQYSDPAAAAAREHLIDLRMDPTFFDRKIAFRLRTNAEDDGEYEGMLEQLLNEIDRIYIEKGVAYDEELGLIELARTFPFLRRLPRTDGARLAEVYAVRLPVFQGDAAAVPSGVVPMMAGESVVMIPAARAGARLAARRPQTTDSRQQTKIDAAKRFAEQFKRSHGLAFTANADSRVTGGETVHLLVVHDSRRPEGERALLRGSQNSIQAMFGAGVEFTEIDRIVAHIQILSVVARLRRADPEKRIVVIGAYDPKLIALTEKSRVGLLTWESDPEPGALYPFTSIFAGALITQKVARYADLSDTERSGLQTLFNGKFDENVFNAVQRVRDSAYNYARIAIPKLAKLPVDRIVQGARLALEAIGASA